MTISKGAVSREPQSPRRPVFESSPRSQLWTATQGDLTQCSGCYVAFVDAPSPVDDVVRSMQVGATDAEVLSLLTLHADALVGEELVHRLVPFASRLATLEYRGYPWAGLSSGAAICAIDRTLGRSILSAARLEFVRSGDGLGEGYGCFLEGLEDLGEGNLESASQWWSKAAPLLGTQAASMMVSSHLALAAYAAGDVKRAISLGERALWAAENSRDARAEMLACMGLGLYHLASGRVSCADLHIRRGIQTSERVAPINRYELPMLMLLDAVLHTLRGDVTGAEDAYTAAINDAIERGNRWYEAIGRSVRAEFTANRNPQRSIVDARAALGYLDSIDETWWSRSARIAYATAHLRVGNLSAGASACATLLEMEINPLDRGRTLLVLAELAAADNDPNAALLGEQARDLLVEMGALYWAGRANMFLSRVDHRRREFHRRRAVNCAGKEASDPAWQAVLRGPGALSLRLLGTPNLAIDAAAITFETHAELECLAMLALAPRSLPATTIGDRLWPDDDGNKVKHRVDNLISGLRRRLEPTSRITRDRTGISIELLPGECDVRDLLAAAEARLQDRPSAISLAGIIEQLQRRPLLEGIDAPWIGHEQDRLNHLTHRLSKAR